MHFSINDAMCFGLKTFLILVLILVLILASYAGAWQHCVAQLTGPQFAGKACC